MEVEPDSVGQLTLSSQHARGAGAGEGGAPSARERARYLPAFLVRWWGVYGGRRHAGDRVVMR